MESEERSGEVLTFEAGPEFATTARLVTHTGEGLPREGQRRTNYTRGAVIEPPTAPESLPIQVMLSSGAAQDKQLRWRLHDIDESLEIGVSTVLGRADASQHRPRR